MKFNNHSIVYNAARKNNLNFDWHLLTYQEMLEAYRGCFFLNLETYSSTQKLVENCAVWNIKNFNLFIKQAHKEAFMIKTNMLQIKDKTISDYIFNHIICPNNINDIKTKKTKI